MNVKALNEYLANGNVTAQDAADVASRLLLTSDIHTSGLDSVKPMKDTEIVVIAGDVMGAGMDSWDAGRKWWDEVFCKWADSLKEKGIEIVLIPGNHDKHLWRAWHQDEEMGERGVPSNCHYLINCGCTVKGLKFYGMPWCENDRPHRFECSAEDMAKYCARIPSGLDVLVTHCPPAIPGENVDVYEGVHEGSVEIADAILRAKPKICVCGHVHGGSRDKVKLGDTVVMNVARVRGDRSKGEVAPKAVDLEAIAMDAIGEYMASEAETETEDANGVTTLAEHDAQYHKPKYDPNTMTCEFRERRAKSDPADADVVPEGGIKGIFTGSAASYTRPSLIHVGTGEGSQVYGWGLYGSNVRGVAESYAKAQSGNTGRLRGVDRSKLNGPQRLAYNQLVRLQGDFKKARKAIETTRDYETTTDKKPFNDALEYLSELESNKAEFMPDGKVYEQTFFTDRAPGDESHLLSWYEPVSPENSKRFLDSIDSLSVGDIEGLKTWEVSDEEAESDLKKIKDKLRKIGYEIGMEKTTDPSESRIWGEGLYEGIARAIDSVIGNKGEKNASMILARAGIDGIKYPVDSYGDKGVKDGDKAGWNYVSFRDDNIRVDKKYVDGEEVGVKDSAPARYLDMC